jgi:hypothetical protein
LPNNTCGVNKTHPRAPSAVEVTAAVQATINAAAAAGNGAEAYFPKGSYGLTSTVLIKGTNHFYITGSGYQTQITGGGSCANASSFCGPLFSVAAGSHVTLGWMQIFPSNQTADMERIEIHGGGHTNVTINGVQMQGYNEGKREWASGIHVDGFVPSDVLDVIYTDGDMTATGNEGTIIVGFHLAGTVNLKPSGQQLAEYAVAAAKAAAGEGAPIASKGFFGELMRFTCCAHDFTTKIQGSANYVVENLYQESGLNYIHAKGIPGAPPGVVAVSAIKTYTTTTTNSVADGWAGLWWMSGGGVDFQPTKSPTSEAVSVFINDSAATNAVFLLTQPSCDLPVLDSVLYKVTNPKATLTKIGNVLTNDTMWAGPPNDLWPVGAVPNAVQGLDAMRRLARLDLQIHYPELGVKDICV